jgi:glutamate-1-semialdehyde aminotransferase
MSKPARIIENITQISELRHSQRLDARARDVTPDDVAAYSQNRAPHPLYLSRAAGTRLFDVDGKENMTCLLSSWPEGTASQVFFRLV